MNTQTRSFFSPSRIAAFILNFGRKALACSLVYLMVPLGMGDIYAQTAPPPPPDQQQYQDQAPPPPDQQQDYDQDDQGPPPENYNALSPDQLNQLVAPIALYPDSLVAQILAASTFPSEVADADHFLQSNQGMPADQLGDMVNGMDWDPSVKALIAFPSVLNNLDRNLEWTTQLGNAYYNQPQDVMSAVQDMRQRAYEAGNLRSTQQLAVEYSPGDIVIAPANPEVVYIPWYDPWTVYGTPLSPWSGYYVRPRPAGFFFASGLGIGFGIGIGVSHWNRWGWGYHHWGMGWRDRTVVYNRTVYVSRSPHVRNHGYYGRFDRNNAARNYNRNIEVRARRSQPAYLPGARRGNNNRPSNNVRRAPEYNRNNNVRRAPNMPNYRPENNNRRTPNANRPENTRPNNNVRQAPTYNRPNNNVRQAPNFNRENNRPNVRQAPNYNRPNNNVRQAPNYNRPNNNVRRVPTLPNSRPNNRPSPNFNRPQPQARPQPRPQARPEARPQARPQSRPENRQPHPNNGRGHENNGHGHERDGH